MASPPPRPPATFPVSPPSPRRPGPRASDWSAQSENAALEWALKPVKVTVSSVVSKKPSVGLPTIAAVYENVFEF